ncbi:MAG: hypothetical protein SH868_09055 [Bythopirellula sp.]|nr:hypothetical protein [Bythopirellula sp.]
MSRKKKKQPVANIVPPVDKKVDEAGRKLVNNLSIADARHLIRTEGGEIAPTQIVIQTLSIVVVAATSAYAIWFGNATAWHLVLPMVGEYLALLAGIVVAYAIVRHPDMKKEARNSLILLIVLAGSIATTVMVQARRREIPWETQLQEYATELWSWITDHYMLLPILCATAGVLLDLPTRVGNLLKYGPPFVAAGLGCGTRAAMVFLSFFILPFLVTGTERSNAWILWGMLVLAETVALGMHWDVQRRLKKLDGPGDIEATS